MLDNVFEKEKVADVVLVEEKVDGVLVSFNSANRYSVDGLLAGNILVEEKQKEADNAFTSPSPLLKSTR